MCGTVSLLVLSLDGNKSAFASVGAIACRKILKTEVLGIFEQEMFLTSNTAMGCSADMGCWIVCAEIEG
jgi:hypothetical protein